MIGRDFCTILFTRYVMPFSIANHLNVNIKLNGGFDVKL